MNKKKGGAMSGGKQEVGTIRKLRIVSIGAHPADVFDQSGGTVSYGEGFIRMNAEVHYYLPLTAYARRKSRDSDHAIMRRYSWRFPMPEPDSMRSRPDPLKE